MDTAEIDRLESILSVRCPRQTRVAYFAGLPDISDQVPYFARSCVGGMGMQLHVMSGAYAVSSLPVEGNHQHTGFMHGGATALLGETTGSFAATTLIEPDGYALGLDISVHHHRPATEGRVWCVATLVSKTRTIANYQLHFFRADGKISASGYHSCALRMKDRDTI